MKNFEKLNEALSNELVKEYRKNKYNTLLFIEKDFWVLLNENGNIFDQSHGDFKEWDSMVKRYGFSNGKELKQYIIDNASIYNYESYEIERPAATENLRRADINTIAVESAIDSLLCNSVEHNNEFQETLSFNKILKIRESIEARCNEIRKTPCLDEDGDESTLSCVITEHILDNENILISKIENKLLSIGLNEYRGRI